MKYDVELLILGLGNVLYGDDGLGIAAVHLVEQRYSCPNSVRLADGGTLGLSLLPLLEQARKAIIVDAIRCAGVPAGEIVRLKGEEVAPAVRSRLSPHQIGVADLLDGAELIGRVPEELLLLGLVPDALDFGIGFSAAVNRNLTSLAHAVVAEAARMGHGFVALPPSDRALQASADLGLITSPIRNR